MRTQQAPSLSTQEKPNALERWRPLFAPELARMDEVIFSMAESETELIPTLTRHIVASGGKRLRPTLTILSAKCCGYEGQRHINLAAAIEFIHTATLLHDDVVDESDLRRGEETANHVWGNAASVLVGDFLLSKSFQLMARDGNMKVLQILSDISAIISEGEVLQLTHVRDIQVNEEIYLKIITAKTAALFAAACQIGAVIAGKPEEQEQALYDFGLNLGIAFQIVDDALDYSALQEELGKTIGDDFREGKVTLPVILACTKAGKEERAFWERVIVAEESGGEEDMEQAIAYIEAADTIAASVTCARIYAQRAADALLLLPDGEPKNALLDLLDFSVNRMY